MEVRAWIITTVFNRFDALDRYLKCLSNQDYSNFRLVLVDHGIKLVKDHFPNLPSYVELVHSTRDKWWTAAVNVGIHHVLNHQEAQEQDVIILQNEDSVISGRFVSNLMQVVQQEQCVVGSLAINKDTGKILHANLKFDALRAKYRYLFAGQDPSILDSTPLPSDVLKGRGVAYPLSIVRKIGLLEEKLPQYKSDHEWAHRARKQGFRTIVTPLAVTEAVIDTQTRMNDERPFWSWKELLFGRRSTCNLHDSYTYFIKCFGPIKGLYYFVISASWTIAVTSLQTLRGLIRRARSS